MAKVSATGVLITQMRQSVEGVDIVSGKEIDDIPDADPALEAETAAMRKKANERGPLTITLPADLGTRLLRRCHDDGVAANEATALLWERALRKDGSVVGEDEE